MQKEFYNCWAMTYWCIWQERYGPHPTVLSAIMMKIAVGPQLLIVPLCNVLCLMCFCWVPGFTACMKSYFELQCEYSCVEKTRFNHFLECVCVCVMDSSKLKLQEALKWKSTKKIRLVKKKKGIIFKTAHKLSREVNTFLIIICK